MKKVGDIYQLTTNARIYNISEMDYVNPLGRGAFGIVYKANDQDGVECAIKKIFKNASMPMEQIKREIETMMQVLNVNGQCNVIYAIDWIEDDNHDIFIVMPYFNCGNLDEIIRQKKITTEDIALEYFRQICYGMMILHSLGVLHRDLKCQNILIKSYKADDIYHYDHLLYVSDYGLAKQLINQPDSSQTMNVGTSYTRAPEVSTSNYDKKADVYSLGCIFYKMVTGMEPFNGSNEADIDKKKKAEVLPIKPQFVLHNYSKFILESCLQYDPNKRISSDDLYLALNVLSIYSNFSSLIKEDVNLSAINLKNGYKALTTEDHKKVYKQFKKSELSQEKSKFIPTTCKGMQSGTPIKIQITNKGLKPKEEQKKERAIPIANIVNKPREVNTTEFKKERAKCFYKPKVVEFQFVKMHSTCNIFTAVLVILLSMSIAYIFKLQHTQYITVDAQSSTAYQNALSFVSNIKHLEQKLISEYSQQSCTKMQPVKSIDEWKASIAQYIQCAIQSNNANIVHYIGLVMNATHTNSSEFNGTQCNESCVRYEEYNESTGSKIFKYIDDLLNRTKAS